MDTSVITAIVQGIVQIATIIGTIWALFNKKTSEIEQKLELRMNKLDHKMTMMKNQDQYTNKRP